jgi:hypothetical protein
MIAAVQRSTLSFELLLLGTYTIQNERKSKGKGTVTLVSIS